MLKRVRKKRMTIKLKWINKWIKKTITTTEMVRWRITIIRE